MKETFTSPRRLLMMALIASLISIMAHFYLASEHYKLKFGVADGKSFCNISETISCDKVALSDYSTLLGVPMAVWGANTHAIFSLLVLLILLGWIEWASLGQRLATWLAVFIFATSLVMGGISVFVIGSYCLFCIGTYALSAVIAFAMLRASSDKLLSNLKGDLGELFGEQRWLVALLVVIPAMSFMSNAMVLDGYGAKDIKLATQESLRDWREATAISFDQESGLRIEATQPNPVVLVEFADYLCPHCKHASPTLESFVKAKGNITMIFKAFPLDATCNVDLPHKGDGLRCQLAYFSTCAEKVAKKGWEAHHWIFDHQESLSASSFDADLAQACRDLDLNLDLIEACLEDDQVRASIARQAKEGVNASVKGTPSIFLNGKFLDHGQMPMVLDAAYQEAVKEAAKAYQPR